MNNPKILSLILLLVVTGCGSARISEYHPVSAKSEGIQLRSPEVEIQLDPFIEKERTQQYFGINGVQEGIAILHVRITNKTESETFIVQKERFDLFETGRETGSINATQKVERSKAAADAIGIIGAVGVAPVLLLTAGNMASYSTEIQRNFSSKEMGDQTLPPGQTMSGFVYFKPLPKGKDWSLDHSIKIKMTGTKSHREIEVTGALIK